MSKGTVTASNGATLTKKGQQATGEQGKLVILRPSKLAEEGVTGLVAEGIYEGAVENKFNPDKKDFKIRGADNTLYIINETAGLKRGMADVTVGDLVQIHYEGKSEIKSGKSKGKSFHNFSVFA